MNNHLSFNSVSIRSSHFIRTFTFIALLVLTGCLIVKPADAAKECYFKDAPYTATLSFSGSVVSLLPHVTSTQMITDLNQKATTTKSARTDCRAGDSGEILYGIAGAVSQTGYYSDVSPTAGLYATNIPGILYSVQIRGTGGAGNIKAFMPYFYGSSERMAMNTEDMESSMDWGQWYDYYIVLFQTPQFTGIPSGVTSIQPATPGYIGAFRVGKEDTDNHRISLDMSSFSFPVKTPTCTSLVSSVGGGTIPLGDYSAAKVNSGATSVMKFSLNASGCTNVNMFKIRVTTNIVAPGNNMLLGNSVTSNAATGVGVKITTGSGSQLKPNDTNSIYSVTDLNMPSSKQLQFNAQLVGDSKSISVGSFSATGTFVVNYE
jgi:type 1 fimbria pilin